VKKFILIALLLNTNVWAGIHEPTHAEKELQRLEIEPKPFGKLKTIRKIPDPDSSVGAELLVSDLEIESGFDSIIKKITNQQSHGLISVEDRFFNDPNEGGDGSFSTNPEYSNASINNRFGLFDRTESLPITYKKMSFSVKINLPNGAKIQYLKLESAVILNGKIISANFETQKGEPFYAKDNFSKIETWGRNKYRVSTRYILTKNDDASYRVVNEIKLPHMKPRNDVVIPDMKESVKKPDITDNTECKFKGCVQVPLSVDPTGDDVFVLRAMLVVQQSVMDSLGVNGIKAKFNNVATKYKSFMWKNNVKSARGKHILQHAFNDGVPAIHVIPDSLCISVGGCNGNIKYADLIGKATYNDDIYNLKADSKADITIFLLKHKGVGEIAGIAHLLSKPGDLNQAKAASAAVAISSNWESWVHEISHLMGAGHSPKNSDPGRGYARAVLYSFYDRSHWDTVCSFMTYDYICEDYHKRKNLLNQDITLDEIVWTKKYSAPTIQGKIRDVVWRGGFSQNNNRRKVKEMISTTQSFSKHYVSNIKPVISSVMLPGKPNETHCWNGATSTIGGNYSVEWSITLPNGSEVSRQTKNFITDRFCFKPITIGSYTVNLKLALGERARSTSSKFEVALLESPIVTMTGSNYFDFMRNIFPYHQVSWKKVNSADYYEVYVNDRLRETVEYTLHASFSPLSTGSVVKVRACKKNQGCGGFTEKVVQPLCPNVFCPTY